MWPPLMNRRGGFPFHNNARPRADVIIRQKLMVFDWKILSHPPYSPDLAPTKYHLFFIHALNNSFSQKIYDDLDALETQIQQFFNRNRRNFTTVGCIFTR
ncbi:transposase [Trichonephila clavipes]|nr:transposase [Trichonephila clavipes]